MISSISAQEAKKMFYERGISITEWASAHHFSVALVYAVLDGKRKCLRGQSHQIAIALGLKEERRTHLPVGKGEPLMS